MEEQFDNKDLELFEQLRQNLDDHIDMHKMQLRNIEI